MRISPEGIKLIRDDWREKASRGVLGSMPTGQMWTVEDVDQKVITEFVLNEKHYAFLISRYPGLEQYIKD